MFFVNAIFNIIVFKILLFKGRSLLLRIQQCTWKEKRAKFLVKKCSSQTVWKGINLNLGGLFKGWFWEGGDKITPCLKLVGIMVQTSNLARKYTHTYYAVLENIAFSTKPLLIFLMSAFFAKKSAFFGKNNAFTQINILRAMSEIF